MATAARADVGVTGQPLRDGGLLVLTWERPITHEASLAGRVLALTLSEPFPHGSAVLSQALPDVITRADISADRRVVSMVLNGSYRLTDRSDGETITLVLQKASSKPSAGGRIEDAPPEPKREATPGKLETVVSRYGRHDKYERLVFEWPRNVGYNLIARPKGATVVFDRPGKVDLNQLRKAMRRSRIRIEEVPNTESLTLRLSFDHSRAVKHFPLDNKIVVDVLNEPFQPPSAPEPETSDAAIPGQDDGESVPTETRTDGQPRPTDGVEKGKTTADVSTPEDEPAEAATERRAPEPLKPRSKPTKRRRSAPETTAKEAPEQKAVTAGAGTKPEVAAVPKGHVPLTLRKEGDAVTLVLGWSDDVAAAAFRRGQYIWVLFDRAASIDLSAAHKRKGDQIYSIEQFEDPAFTVLRITASRHINVAMQRQDQRWEIELSTALSRPSHDLRVLTNPYARAGGRIVIETGELGRILEFHDPIVGDDLTIVPLTTAGAGLGSSRTFPGAQLLSTAQGVVVEPYSDDVRVRLAAGDVEITAAGGLYLSDDPETKPSRTDGEIATARMFDFAEWMGADEDRFPRMYPIIEHELMQAVAVAGDRERNDRRLALARFYFSHGVADQTLGILRLIHSEEPEYLQEPSIQALYGAAALWQGDVELAQEILFQEAFDREPEVALWRGVLYAVSNNWGAAASNFEQAEGLLQQYPRRHRIRFAPLAAEAELHAGTTERAQSFLNIIREEKLPKATVDEMAYLSGRFLERSDEVDAALAHWEKTAATADNYSRVKSDLARVQTMLASGRLTDPRAAIETLDRLRFAWRGDALEFAVLHLLGQLHLENKDYRQGLATLRYAQDLYGSLANDAGIPATMRDVFANLFLKDEADDMTPVKAVALFEENQDLLPPGRRGDEMIELLSDRLASVDLLDQAANLLERQVADRLVGEDKARTGARLATLYLLDRRPEKALAALTASASAEASSSVSAQRRLLEARALVEQERFGDALLKVTADSGREVELLRADAYWRSHDWQNAAKSYSALTADMHMPTGDETFPENDSRVVLQWAVALALAGDTKGLAELRRRFDGPMQHGPYAEPYRVIATEAMRRGVLDYASVVERIRGLEKFSNDLSGYRTWLQPGTPSSAVN